eukprot:472256-Pyramimonas_sp.AAC.1
MELPPHRDRPAFPRASTIIAEGHLGSGKLTISTIDSSQGGEADLGIYLTTRSNSWHDWGFTDYPNGVNVAITRATTNVVILGDGR